MPLASLPSRASPVGLANGSTATEGVSGSAGAGDPTECHAHEPAPIAVSRTSAAAASRLSLPRGIADPPGLPSGRTR